MYMYVTILFTLTPCIILMYMWLVNIGSLIDYKRACRCISKHIEITLSNDYLEAWQSRARVEFVIVVDWHSHTELFKPGNHIRSLIDALYKVCVVRFGDMYT